MNEVTRKAILRGVGAATEAHDALRLRDRHEDGLSAVDVFDAISELSIPMEFEALDDLLGTFVRLNSTTVGILVTTRRDLHMQRFTAAHELGHFVLEHEGSYDREVRLPGDTEGRPIVEVEADAFAAEFLMPKWLIKPTASRRSWWGQDALTDASVVYQLSLRLALSYQATCWGLVAQEYIPKHVGKGLAEVKPKELKRVALRGVSLPDPWADVWILGHGDAGATINAGKNDRFIVELDERAASGYRWDPARAIDAGFELLSDESAVDPSRVGAASRRRFVFAAPPPGVHQLAVPHRRSFASRGNDLETVEVSVSTVGSLSAAPASALLH